MNAWKSKINQIVMTSEEGKRKKTELKIAGYCNPVLDMNEDELVVAPDSFKNGNYNVTLCERQKCRSNGYVKTSC